MILVLANLKRIDSDNPFPGINSQNRDIANDLIISVQSTMESQPKTATMELYNSFMTQEIQRAQLFNNAINRKILSIPDSFDVLQEHDNNNNEQMFSKRRWIKHHSNLLRRPRSTVYRKRFARLKHRDIENNFNETIIKRNVVPETMNTSKANNLDTHNKYNESHIQKHLHQLYINRLVALDAERAYLCLVFLILVLIAAAWMAGICRTRKESYWNVVDFEQSQPLTTVKDAILRKSRYLPMFADFYRNRIRRNEYI
ncbi:hypothetical protein SNE40_002461 [Patella caerulea]|uniref:Uncharacterized protein n=3 Tax=Patella caerulea TaxID=87958 RepID=A0AAN8PZV8_PATCE